MSKPAQLFKDTSRKTCPDKSPVLNALMPKCIQEFMLATWPQSPWNRMARPPTKSACRPHHIVTPILINRDTNAVAAAVIAPTRQPEKLHCGRGSVGNCSSWRRWRCARCTSSGYSDTYDVLKVCSWEGRRSRSSNSRSVVDEGSPFADRDEYEVADLMLSKAD